MPDTNEQDPVKEARALSSAIPNWKLISYDASETHTRIGYFEHGSRFTVATVRTFEGPAVDKPLAELFARAPELLKTLCDEVELLRREIITFASSESELKDILSCDKCDLCEDHHA